MQFKLKCRKVIEISDYEGSTLQAVYYVIGNTSIFDFGDDTGEPFVIGDLPAFNMSGIGVLSTVPNGDYAIKITETKVHKIDPKYYELPCYSEYYDTIVINSENTSVDINFPFELIGTKVKDVRENRYMLKTPSIRPDVENNTLLHAESDLISIYYSDMDMANNPILVIGGSLIAMQLYPSLLNNNLVLVYLFEQTGIANLNQTFEKGWYLIKDLPSGLSIESFNLDENPIFFPLNLEGEENSTYLQNELISSAHVIEYVITEKNIFGNNNPKYITYFNNYILDQIKSGTLLVHGWTGLAIMLLGSSFMINNNRIEILNTTGGFGAFTIYISPIKELKKIEPQYLTHIQADYTQNDSTQANYIRNRLAWTEPIQKVLINTFLSNEDFVKDETNETYDYINPTILNLEENKLYGINYSPDAYANLFCKKYNNTLYLGNYSLYDSNGPTENINFVIIDNKDSGFLLKTTSTNIFEVFAIETLDEIVHEIDEKYIPDTIARVKDIKNNIVITLDTFDEEGTISMTGPEIVDSILNGKEVILTSLYGIFRATFVTWDGSTVVFHSTSSLLNDGGEEDPCTYEIRVDDNGNYQLSTTVNLATKDYVKSYVNETILGGAW